MPDGKMLHKQNKKQRVRGKGLLSVQKHCLVVASYEQGTGHDARAIE